MVSKAGRLRAAAVSLEDREDLLGHSVGRMTTPGTLGPGLPSMLSFTSPTRNMAKGSILPSIDSE